MNTNELQILLDRYREIVALELEQFGCKATEVRHLIGRMGEFFCAITVNGTLAHVTNQHGFDVVSVNGRRISVKTTAQKQGFVTINPRTLTQVDDLMFLQYRDGEFNIVYFGEIAAAVKDARIWKDKYELDISKARRLNSNFEQGLAIKRIGDERAVNVTKPAA